jgi:hypothetical protein
MSFVIPTPDRYEIIRKTLAHIAAQNVRDRLEVVIVAPSAQGLRPDEEELSVFHSWRVVEVCNMNSTSKARAAGIGQASAPLVALGEEHSYPQAGWAEALLAAHQGPWAAVGPAVCNANPASAASWANFLIEYGHWMWPAEAGEREHLPGHNSSYKREVLLAYGDRLPALLDAESVLHWDMRAHGHRLYLEPAARTHHLNPSRLLPWLPNRLRAGRSFAGSRARGWPWPRRLYYTLGALLLPARAMPIALQRIQRAGLTRDLVPRILPALVVTLAADGLGRSAGYAFGFGGRDGDFHSLEFRRHEFLNEHDRQAEAARRPAPAS